MRQAYYLLMNDLHVSVNNIAEFRKNWQEAFEVCKEYDITHVVIGGDIFTAQASQTLPVLMAVHEMFTFGLAQGIHFDVAAGNHDKVDKDDFNSYCHLYVYNDVNIIDDYDIFYSGKCVLAVMSYFPENGSFKKHLDELIEELEEMDEVSSTTLYIHEGVQGALGGLVLDTECPVEWFKDFKQVLCGHYHNRIKIKDSNIEYIGSSRQNNFGEDEEKGYTILYNDGTTEFVKNEANTRYRTIEFEYDDDIEPIDDPRYKTRLILNCTSEQSKTIDKSKLIALGYNKVELKTEKVKSVRVKDTDIDQRYDKNGIKKEYKNFCNTKEIEPDLGLKYLDKLN